MDKFICLALLVLHLVVAIEPLKPDTKHLLSRLVKSARKYREEHPDLSLEDLQFEVFYDNLDLVAGNATQCQISIIDMIPDIYEPYFCEVNTTNPEDTIKARADAFMSGIDELGAEAVRYEDYCYYCYIDYFKD